MITFFTLVLDGMPWLAHHFPVFCQLKMPWHWIIVEGVADAVNCTSWCSKIPPRLSNDGTNEYLRYLAAKDQRVTHLQQPLWNGKVAMCNAALALIKEPCLLWQVDSDELWKENQIQAAINLFDQYQDATSAYFRCRYFVGPDRYVTPMADTYGNHTSYEWKRVWRFKPGNRFLTHEPPVMSEERLAIPHHVTEAEGIVFDHMALATKKSVEFRSHYYAGSANLNAPLWRGAVEQWERLQDAELPCKLQDYFKWVDSRATVVKL